MRTAKNYLLVAAGIVIAVLVLSLVSHDSKAQSQGQIISPALPFVQGSKYKFTSLPSEPGGVEGTFTIKSVRGDWVEAIEVEDKNGRPFRNPTTFWINTRSLVKIELK